MTTDSFGPVADVYDAMGDRHRPPTPPIPPNLEPDDDALVDQAVEAAINAGAKVIQDALGVKTGDCAAEWFSGERAELKSMFGDYLDVQRIAHQHDQTAVQRPDAIRGDDDR